MSGFIDPTDSTDARLERLEMLVTEMAEQVNPDTLSAEAQILLTTLIATKSTRNPRVQARLLNMAGLDPTRFTSPDRTTP